MRAGSRFRSRWLRSWIFSSRLRVFSLGDCLDDLFYRSPTVGPPPRTCCSYDAHAVVRDFHFRAVAHAGHGFVFPHHGCHCCARASAYMGVRCRHGSWTSFTRAYSAPYTAQRCSRMVARSWVKVRLVRVAQGQPPRASWAVVGLAASAAHGQFLDDACPGRADTCDFCHRLLSFTDRSALPLETWSHGTRDLARGQFQRHSFTVWPCTTGDEA